MEYKFRAWDIENNYMLNWHEIQEEWNTEGYYPSIFNQDHYVCMQYICQKDKYGKEIYDRDIIRWTDWKGTVRDSIVKYDYEYNRFCVWLNGTENMGVNKYLSDNIQIIGNIYENPELVK